MALSSGSKNKCLTETIKIVTAYASNAATGIAIDTYLDKIYKKLCELQEDVEKG